MSVAPPFPTGWTRAAGWTGALALVLGGHVGLAAVILRADTPPPPAPLILPVEMVAPPAPAPDFEVPASPLAPLTDLPDDLRPPEPDLAEALPDLTPLPPPDLTPPEPEPEPEPDPLPKPDKPKPQKPKPDKPKPEKPKAEKPKPQAPPRTAPAPEAPRRVAAATGGGTASGQAAVSASQQATWESRVRQIAARHMARARIGARGAASVTLTLRLNAGGQVVAVAVAQSSGDAAVDAALVRHAGRLRVPPPPGGRAPTLSQSFRISR